MSEENLTDIHGSDSGHPQRSFAPEGVQTQPTHQNPGIPGGSPGWPALFPEHQPSGSPLDQDQAVAQAWQQPAWADYFGLSRTLSTLSVE
jgi:hypothetical protein